MKMNLGQAIGQQGGGRKQSRKGQRQQTQAWTGYPPNLTQIVNRAVEQAFNTQFARFAQQWGFGQQGRMPGKQKTGKVRGQQTQTVKGNLPDQVLLDKVVSILGKNQKIDPTNIDLVVKNGSITLNGIVATPKQKKIVTGLLLGQLPKGVQLFDHLMIGGQQYYNNQVGRQSQPHAS